MIVITDGAKITLPSNPEEKKTVQKYANVDLPVIRKKAPPQKKKRIIRAEIKPGPLKASAKPQIDVQHAVTETLSMDVSVSNHETDNSVVQNPAAAPFAGEEGKPVMVKFGSVEGPQFVRQVLPRYPVMAKRLNKEGELVLILTIDKDGKLINAEVTKKGGFGFDEEALKAVRKSLFSPSVIGGRPTVCKVLLTVRFELR